MNFRGSGGVFEMKIAIPAWSLYNSVAIMHSLYCAVKWF